jgi:3-hydroxyisobutyrate dehydrogenase-like beta-hydroxyacid dehydrogenase
VTVSDVVGIVGVGRMGRGMWSRLGERGFETVVYDVSPAARDAAAEAGAKVLGSAEEVGANARIVVLSVPRSDDVETAMLGDAGVAVGFASGGDGPATVLDTTSGRPAISRRIAEALTARGIDYLDVGVTGGVAGAAAGTLRLMIGGDAAVVARCDAVLAAIGATRFHCGAVGAGHAMKTVLNMANQTKMAADLEALLLGRAAGLDPHQVAEVLGLGVWQTFLLGEGGRRPFGFTLELVGKDYDVAAELAAEQGIPLPVNAAGLQVLRAARRQVGGDTDLIESVGVAERNAGVGLDERGSA